MQVTVEQGTGLERRMRVDLPADEIQAKLDKRAREIAKTIRMDGFRPGKAPVSVVKHRYKERLFAEVLGESVDATLYKAAEEQALMPVGQPQIEPHIDEKEGRYGYVATFQVMPEIVVGDLSALKVTRPVADITDGDLNDMIERLRKQRIEWNAVDRAAQNDDRLMIDFRGLMDGEAFEGGSGENTPIVLGSGSMIDGFEQGLLGATANDERTLELTFPEDYRATHLAGKAVTFEVKVREVAEPEMPGLDEEFFAEFGVKEGGEEAFRSEIRKYMDRELKQRIKAKVKNQVMDALLTTADFEVPKAMVDKEAKGLQEQMRQATRGQSNMSLPISVFESQAERRVKLGLLVGELIRQNDIQLDEDRLRQEIDDLAATYEDPDEVKAHYAKDKTQRENIENMVIEDQLIDWILGQVQVEEEQSDFATLTAQEG